MAAASATARMTRGDGPSGFSLAERRVIWGTPSSAARESRGRPASYGVRRTSTSRQRFRMPELYSRGVAVMSPEMYRRALRAEARAKGPDERRRLRLEFFRAALTEGFDSLKLMHA